MRLIFPTVITVKAPARNGVFAPSRAEEKDADRGRNVMGAADVSETAAESVLDERELRGQGIYRRHGKRTLLVVRLVASSIAVTALFREGLTDETEEGRGTRTHARALRGDDHGISTPAAAARMDG